MPELDLQYGVIIEQEVATNLVYCINRCVIAREMQDKGGALGWVTKSRLPL